MGRPNRKKNLGGYLVLALPLVFILFSLLIMIIELNRMAYSVEWVEKAADALLGSALSARSEALEKLAAKWEELRPIFREGNSTGAVIDHSSWDALKKKSADLKKSLPGYKGRIKSVMTVVGEANGIDRTKIQVIKEEGLALEVETLGQWVVDDTGRREKISDLIFRRTWASLDKKGQPMEPARILISEPFHPWSGNFFDNGTPALIDRTSSGHVVWAADMKDDYIKSVGNGGYPRSWEDALNGNQVEPHRFAYFGTALEAP